LTVGASKELSEGSILQILITFLRNLKNMEKPLTSIQTLYAQLKHLIVVQSLQFITFKAFGDR